VSATGAPAASPSRPFTLVAPASSIATCAVCRVAHRETATPATVTGL
jgi:hypothetical protein